MSTIAMFPHIPGHVDTTDLYVRASLGMPIHGAEVLALMSEAEDLDAELAAAEQRHKEECEEATKDYEKLEAVVEGLKADIVKLERENDDLTDKLEAAGSHTLTEYERMEAERDEAVRAQHELVNASITWTSTALCALIVDQSERTRLENVALKAELLKVRAVLTPKQRKAL